MRTLSGYQKLSEQLAKDAFAMTGNIGWGGVATINGVVYEENKRTGERRSFNKPRYYTEPNYRWLNGETNDPYDNRAPAQTRVSFSQRGDV